MTDLTALVEGEKVIVPYCHGLSISSCVTLERDNGLFRASHVFLILEGHTCTIIGMAFSLSVST